ncbi:MAG: hypothetical protein LKJ66_14140 [Clostridium luticellarii]|jgi:2-polyprenyl-3-methyl-5-hydroxy-6-metoxy-1,4-benzoquinol methylase|uniref:hypothetical protein n=1 Tax=Clostridium luticellarii TaxID=1691940 RepID=UPI002354286A|nr:hypothetical protein [Clostridium luticellarii]MCI2041193.1 hypothetical protein [Clostridium luticellarii]
MDEPKSISFVSATAFLPKFLAVKNVLHLLLSDWGLKHLQLRNTDHVLDIGCGGGANTSDSAAEEKINLPIKEMVV